MSSEKKPALIVFAGPNGSGKSTIATADWIKEPYINADNIKKATYCSDLEAAQEADRLREQALEQRQDFSFETVLSTNRKLQLLQLAKTNGYFIRGYFILTSDPALNVFRVKTRVAQGGHDVPEAAIVRRYWNSLANIPKFVNLCDICHIYDNTNEPFRIFRKHKDEEHIFTNVYWPRKRVLKLVYGSDSAKAGSPSSPTA